MWYDWAMGFVTLIMALIVISVVFYVIGYFMAAAMGLGNMVCLEIAWHT